MLSDAKHAEKYKEHAELNLCTYLQYADHSLCIDRAILPIKVNDVGKEGKKRRKEMAFLELLWPRAGS